MRKTPLPLLILLMLLAAASAFAQAAPRTLDARYTLSFWGIRFGNRHAQRGHVVPVKIRAELSLGTAAAPLGSLKLEEILAFMSAKS